MQKILQISQNLTFGAAAPYGRLRRGLRRSALMPSARPFPPTPPPLRRGRDRARGVLAIGLASRAEHSAQSERLDEVRAQQDEIRAQLDDQNAAIDALLGEVSALRVREDKVAGRARRAGGRARRGAGASWSPPARRSSRRSARLKGALGELERLLVSIYRYGEPDEVTVLLNSDGFDELADDRDLLRAHPRLPERAWSAGCATSARRQRAPSTRSRPRSSGWRPRATAIAERQAALAASRADARGARGRRCRPRRPSGASSSQKLAGEEKDLLEALPTPPPAPDGGRRRRDGARPGRRTCRRRPARPPASTPTARRPRRPDAPQAVKDVIAAGNADHEHAVPVRRRPRLVRGVRVRLLGVGQLRAARRRLAVDAARFDRLHDLGRVRPGSVDHRLLESGPRVHGGRRHPLRHLGAPPRWQASMRDTAGYVATHPPGY